MKRAFFQLLPLFLVLFLLSSCRQPAPEPEPSGPTPSAQELAETVFPYSGCADSDHIEYLYAQDAPDQLTLYIANAYSLEEPWEDAALKGEALPERPTPAPTPAPEPTPEPATGMELLRDTLLDCCSDELAGIECVTVVGAGRGATTPGTRSG